jgi:hypothetical protein
MSDAIRQTIGIRGDLLKAIDALRPLAGEKESPTRRRVVRGTKQVKLARRTSRTRSKPRPDVKTPKRRAARAGITLPAPPDIVAARDAVILARLKRGPLPKVDLIESLPPEPGKTPEQRAQDCGNALTRLRLKKLIVQVDEGWAVA